MGLRASLVIQHAVDGPESCLLGLLFMKETIDTLQQSCSIARCHFRQSAPLSHQRAGAASERSPVISRQPKISFVARFR
jgi:hypothetical protein